MDFLILFCFIIIHIGLTDCIFVECENLQLIGNGECDDGYEKNIKCNYDDGDCCAQIFIADGSCDKQNNFASCGYFDGGDCNDENQWPNCPNSNLIGNGECNIANQNDVCYYDGGDCCNQKLVGVPI